MQVDVSGHQFVFPTTCACCKGKADTHLRVSASKSTGKRVTHTSTNVWEIPYCDRCVQHVSAAGDAEAQAWLFGVVSVVAGGMLWQLVTNLYGIPAGIVVCIPVGFVGWFGTVMPYRKRMAEARAMCGPGCVCVERAVRYLGWHGPLHMFWIESLDYALAFMVANQKKLVNLSQEAIDLLASSGQVPPAGAPRAPRRHRS